MTSIPRLVEESDASIIAALYVGVLSIPRSPSVDALVAVQGEDEIWRVIEAVRDWNDYETYANHLFIVGDNWKAGGKGRPEGGKQCPDITLETIVNPPYSLERKENVVIGGFSRNSLTAAQITLAKMEEIGAQSFRLYVSPYHIVRMYLTILKQMIKSDRYLAMIPAMTLTSMEKVAPLSEYTPWELTPGEVARIFHYQRSENGADVATLPELRKYLTWLWQQPVINHCTK